MTTATEWPTSTGQTADPHRRAAASKWSVTNDSADPCDEWANVRRTFRLMELDNAKHPIGACAPMLAELTWKPATAHTRARGAESKQLQK